MKTDAYTKTILTLIAICLIVIAFKDVSFIQSANASPKNTISVPLNPDGTIDVRIVDSEKIDVNIKSVDSYAFTYCTVPVEEQNK